MRDLTAIGCLIVPTGVAFAIADLGLVKSWADYHDFRMTIRLDHSSNDEEYEELLEFRQGWNSAIRIILWRNERSVFIQPLLGRRRQYQSVTDALDSLQASERVVVTDIQAVAWSAPL
jgi:hypothetical protein